ncbi:hypothetical protein INT47_003234 [Mucor saturninus]|uniref:Uncharacterized protein n=1 Tax=Mucor saturninus TaxID=64648 RepID=A0A8H7VD95_9FUNG|nr:hypothetical protein INT47_003234 [Mucor saturninus]
MEDILSPTHTFLDFDFSEFIDKNFDMNNDIFNSPNSKSPLLQLDDFLSSSSDSGSESKNYLDQSPPQWSSMESLSFNKAPPTLSCIDDFIKDPHSDLVQLVQQCNIECSLFQNLIAHSLAEHVSTTPQQILQEQQQQQALYQQQQLQKLQRQNYVNQFPQQLLDLQTFQNYQPPMEPQRKRKINNESNIVQPPQKRVSKSSSYSSNNSSYTHSDSVNAHLLRELIRQAGRNSMHRNGSMDSTCSSSIAISNNGNNSLIFPPDYNTRNFLPDGNYQPYRHPYYTASSSPSSRHSLPYHIQTKKISTKLPKNAINRSSSATKPARHPMGRPSMYSSDISQAQLLEIQAISRAQQDFIRAREQQEAEKEIMMKHQHKKQGV